MSDPQLDALKTALNATPENIPLLILVLNTHVNMGQIQEAYELLMKERYHGLENEEFRMLGASICLKANHPEHTLTFANAETPDALILRSRALLALDRLEEGYRAYQNAVSQNSTLEDANLKAQLTASSPSIQSKNRPRLRVISNDNTDESELHRLLIPQTEKVTFAEVGGLEAIKKQITRKIILPFQKPSLFQKFKKKVGGGILLYGPPGCGKTLLARATAGECNAHFMNVMISDILDMYIGESEQKLHKIFEEARTRTPTVIFFDEIEALGGKRQYTREATSSKLVSQFLSELDGFSQNNQGVLILGATNVPWAVDPAFRRPGRFDRVLFVSPPDQIAREAILNQLFEQRPVVGSVHAKKWAQKTSGFSGADLNNLVETAADEAIECSLDTNQEQSISSEHLQEALTQVKPTTLEWLTTARNYARYANESGQYDEVLDFIKKYGK